MKPFALVALLMTLPLLTPAQRNTIYERADEWKQRSAFVNQSVKTTDWQQNYDITFAYIDVEVHDTSNDIRGNVLYHANGMGDPMKNMKFQLVPELAIDSVLINAVNASFTRTGELVDVELPDTIHASQPFTWQVFYHGKPLNPVEFRGLFHIYDEIHQMNVTYTLSEPFHLKEWLPCKEFLTDKIDSVWTFVTTDTSCMAGSNGLLEQIVPLGNGHHRFEWKTRYPMAYYLISLNVADYTEYNLYAHPAGLSDSILVQNFVYDSPTALPAIQSDLNKVPSQIEMYSELYGMYPFHQEKYGHCQVRLSGAMEHQTMTTAGTFWDWVLAHELAHQWFGDYVTCATWQDIWINEGWATYSEYVFYEETGDVSRMDNWKTQTFFHAKQQALGSVYIPFAEASDEDRIFSWDLSYKKGGAITYMMRYLIGNDLLFYEGIRQFISQYANSNATGDQFRMVMESITQMNLQPYFDEWYYGQGYPIFDVNWENDNASPNTVTINLAVTGSSPVTNFLSLPIPLQLNLNDGSDTLVYIQPTASTGEYTVNTGQAFCQSVSFDPENNIVDSVRSISQTVPATKTDQPVKMYYSDDDQQLKIVVMHPWLLPLEVSVVSADGRTLLRKTISESHSSISVAQLPCAVYTARLENTAIHFHRKFIKAK